MRWESRNGEPNPQQRFDGPVSQLRIMGQLGLAVTLIGGLALAIGLLVVSLHRH